MDAEEQFYCATKQDTSRGQRQKFSKTMNRNKGIIRKLVQTSLSPSLRFNVEAEASGTPLLDEFISGAVSGWDQVEYSLNKKGRWKLTKEFQDNIDAIRENVDSNTRVSMVEAVLLPPETARRGRPCALSYHSTGHDGNAIHRKAKHSYSTVASLVDGAFPHRSKPGKRRGKKVATFRRLPESPDSSDIDYDEPDPEQTEILYEVLRPCNSLSLQKLHLDKASTYKPYTAEYGTTPHVRKSSSKQNNRLSRIISQDLNSDNNTEADLLSDTLKSSLDDSNIPEESLEFVGSTTGAEAYAIADLIVPSNRAKTILNKSRKSSGRSSESWSDASAGSSKRVLTQISELIGQPNGQSETAFENDDDGVIALDPANHDDAFEMIPLELQLFTDTLDSEFLKNNYRSRYFECNCLPRRFVVDVSDAARNVFVVSHGARGISSQDKLAIRVYCIFEVQPKHSFNDFDLFSSDGDELTLSRVWINGIFDASVKSTFLQTINPCEPHSIERVVSAAAKMIGTFPDESFKLITPSHSSGPNPTLTNSGFIAVDGLFEPVKATSEALAEPAALEKALAETKQFRRLQRQLTEVECFMSGFFAASESPDRFCEICFEDLSLDAGLALPECQHWSCASCWREYLGDRIRLGLSPLPCPNYGCSSLVQFDVLTTMFPLELCEKYATNVKAMLLEAKPNEWRLCPNQFCDRILHIPIEDAGAAVASCDCGTFWCLDCQQNAHWPASCEDYKSYYGLLKQNGDEMRPAPEFEKILSVNVKFCPHCQLPVEKGPGCNHMVCRCGHSFCWHCNRKSLPASNHYHCTDHPAQGSTKIPLVDVKIIGELMTEEAYQKCVHHRHARFWKSTKSISPFLDALSSTANDTITGQPPKINSSSFYCQAHYLLEFVNVWLACNKLEKRRRDLIGQLADRAAFLLDRVSESCLSKENSGSRISDFLDASNSLLQQLLRLVKQAKATTVRSLQVP